MKTRSSGSRILAIAISLVMIISLISGYFARPDTANAEGDYGGTVSVSLSDDGRFVVSDGEISGVALAHIDVPLQEVADIDLADWNLEEFSYTDYDTGEPDPDAPTVLKLYLYLLQHYYGSAGSGVPLRASGSPHSFFMEEFWGHDCNLLYYVNGTYPLFEEGWGATADGIILNDGDFVDVAMYTNWNFYTEENAGFNYFATSNSDPASADITFDYDAVTGEPLTVQVIRGMGNVTVGEDTAFQPADDLPVFYGPEVDINAGTEIFLENGKAEITFDNPGTYYVWTEGGAGLTTGDPCSCPCVAKVTVTGEPANKIPRLAPGVSKDASKSINPAVTYSLDLSDIFVDDDKDDLTYKVSVDGADYVTADTMYKYKPSGEGKVTLKFKANDGKADSDDTYTVTLTVSSAVLKPANGLKIVDKECNVYPVYEMIDFDTTSEYEEAGIYNYKQPAYKVVLPAAMDFDVIEEPGKWVFTESVQDGSDRNVTNLAKQWDWIMDMGAVNRYSISKNDYAGSELELDHLFNIPGELATSYGFKEEDYYDEYWDPIKKLTAIEVWGASNSQTKLDEGIESYWLFIEYDKNVKPSAEENGHDLTKVEKKEPTCTENGHEEYWKCSVCGKLFSDAKAKNSIKSPVVIKGGHDWDVPTYIWNDDDTEVTATRVCKKDETHVETETVGVASKDIVMQPHCMRQGRATLTSEEFNNEAFKVQKKNVDTPLDPDRHDYGEWKETKAATCTEKGEEERVCSRNDSHKETRETEVDPDAHAWSDWKTAKESDCVEKGQRFRICRNDVDHVEFEDIDLLDHELEHHEKKDAGCEEAGNIEYWTCSKCGHFFSDSEGKIEIKEEDTVLEALGHDLGEWETVTPASCTEGGSEKRSCSRCDFEEEREVQALGHKWEDDFTVDKEASCTEEGSKSVHCERCDATKYQTEIPKAAHDLMLHEYDAPSCEEGGADQYWECETCGKFFSDPAGLMEIEKDSWLLPAAGHDMSDWNEIKEATCTEKGTEGRFCYNCDLTEERETEALGHSWDDDYTVDAEPTCENEGSKSVHCIRCDAARYKTEIPAKGHNYGDWKVVKEATSSEEGEEQRVCTNDPSHVEKRAIPKKTEPSKDDAKKDETKPSDSKTDEQKSPDENKTEPAAQTSKDPDSKTPSDDNLKKAKASSKLNIKASSISTKAKPSKKQMIVKWKKVKGATNYKIAYRKAGAKKWTEKWTKGKNKYTLKKMKNNGLYEFKLMAVRKSGSAWTKSKWSKVNYRFYAKVKQKLKAGKSSVTVNVSKLGKSSGYEVLTGTSKKVKGMDIRAFNGAKKTKFTIKGQESGKKVFVCSRPYKNYKGNKYVGTLNKVKSVKVK